MDEKRINRNHERLYWIDGLKGFFSISVVLCHLICVFMPGLYDIHQSVNIFEKIWVSTPLNAITNGNTAVQFFFFASGLLVTRNVYIKCDNNAKGLQPFKKYFSFLRLVFPAVTFAFILMSFGLLFHQKAIALDSTLIFANGYNDFEPTITTYLKEVFITPFIKNSISVAPLWTIQYEFWGTLVTTFVAYYVRKNNHNGPLMYLLVTIPLIMINGNYFGFMMGATVFDICANKDSGYDIISRIVRLIDKCKVVKVLLLLVGIYLACCNLQRVGMYSIFRIIPQAAIVRVSGISLFMLATMLLDGVKKILSTEWLVRLGKLSAYIYIFHWPIILSLGCGLFVAFYGKISYYVLIGLITMATLVTTLVLSCSYLKLSSYLDRVIAKLQFKKTKNGDI